MDLKSNVKVSPGYGPVAAAIADNTPMVTAILDTANWDSNTLAVVSGILADAGAEFTLLLEDGDAANLSDAAPVADADLIGTEAAASFIQSDDGVARTLGYKGKRRYLRATLTPTNNASVAPFAMLWLQANPRKAPAT